MSASEDLIDFEIIEGQKENIQSLPGGRSARALATLFSPSPLHKLATPTPSDTKDVNDDVRKEFEDELVTLSESDDPLDIFDRYVKWTLDAYPSAQSTPQSQLLPLLERATKTFLTSPQYKNDPRYLKLWLSYIRFFSDAPRETFAFLARHNVGDGLALFYEEFAAWLEGAGRWKQAGEIYTLGIEREARPTARLVRKFNEFQQRYEQQPQDDNAPTSPALPTVRPALAAKIDPYASVSRDPQAPSQGVGATGPSRAGRQKLTIFSDAEDSTPPAISGGTGPQGWESIGSISDRKKENTMSPKPWVGETLKAGGKKSNVPKMTIFKDESIVQLKNPLHEQATVNPRTGKSEVVFVNLEAVYPNPEISSTEMSFEELRALHRGWLYKDWVKEKMQLKTAQRDDSTAALNEKTNDSVEMADENTHEKFVPDPVLDHDMEGTFEIARDPLMDKINIQEKLIIARDPILDENGIMKESDRGVKSRKFKIQEINQTQIIKTKFSSPSGKKPRRKASAEPTMTIHTRAATDEIYDIFNAPLSGAPIAAAQEDEDEESDEDDGDETDADYTSGCESTGTQRLGSASDMGDETSEVRSEWSDFTARKHIPNLEDADAADINDDDHEDQAEISRIPHEDHTALDSQDAQTGYDNDVVTPVSPQASQSLPSEQAMFVPIQQEDFVPTRPYRDAAQMANNRLPFMTPIAEKTESSLGAQTARGERDYFTSKTPSKANGVLQGDTQGSNRGEQLMSSPFQEILNDSIAPSKLSQPALGYKVSRPSKTSVASKTTAIVAKVGEPLAKNIVPKGPIVKDAQCNPMDDYTRNLIFAGLQPPLSSYDGYFEHLDEALGKGIEIRKFTKAVSKMSKNSGDRTNTNIASPPVLHFPGVVRKYKLKRELGNGAYAPVYLIESAMEIYEDSDENGASLAVMGKGRFDHLNRKELEALKMEDPPSAWEFYIMRQAKRRLGVSRPAESLITAYEMHLYQDECYLIEEFRDQGTLLDLVNLARADSTSAGGVMDESLVMFFSIELFRTIEALHAKGILHGDLKADNCLVRFDAIADDKVWSPRYRRDGTGGWNQKGLALIDFGRGIDMTLFRPDVQFIADWKTSPQDCAEMRELRPWTYQIDYHGLAGIIHSMLFGKYIDTIADGAARLGAGAKKSHRIKESFKRYWQQEIWFNAFDLLLNPLMHVEGEEGMKMPVLKGMKSVREDMEDWLEANCEKGAGLQASIRRLEYALQSRRR